MFGAIVAIVAAVVVTATALYYALSSSKKDADKNFSDKPVGGSTEGCPLCDLYVTVVREDKKGDPNFENTIRIAKPEKTGRAKCDDEKGFLKIDPGKYEVSAKPDAGNGYHFDEPVKVTLAEGEKKKVTVKIKPLEVVEVTPKADGDQLVNLEKKDDDEAWSRTREVEARISEKKKDITVYFDVEPHADNRKTLPDALKAKITASSQTDEKGIAKAQLTLSRFGGDKFKVLASLSKDPKHPSSNTVKSKTLTVWRKVWYQITADKGAAMPSRAKNTAAMKEAFIACEEIDNKIITYKDDIAGLVDHPLWQFRPGSGDRRVVCVGGHNREEFYKQYVAPTNKRTPKAHLIMCDVQWDPKDGPEGTYELKARSGKFTQKNAAGNSTLGVFDPPLAGGSIVKSGTWKWNDGKTVHSGNLTDANVEIKKARGAYSEFEVTLPAKSGGVDIKPTAAKPAEVKLRMKCATGPWAGESGKPGKPQCLIVVDSNANRFNNTIAHEIGHLLKQVREEKSYLDIPDHTDQYRKRGGQGSHCKKDATEHATRSDQGGKKDATEHATRKDQDGNKVYVGGTCIMYHVAVGNTKFCDQCKLDLRIRDLSDFFK